MSKIKLTLGQQQRLNELTVPALVAAFLASPFYFFPFWLQGTSMSSIPIVPWQQKFLLILAGQLVRSSSFLLYGSFGIRCRCAFPQRYQTGYLCQNRLL